MIVVVDYGMGNLGSVVNMLKRVGVPAKASGSEAEIASAEKLILPGVGAFGTGMKNLTDSGLLAVLNDKVLKAGTPVLGICLGMQLFTQWSEEGGGPGLGWIEGKVVRFGFQETTSHKIPHMGWNTIQIKQQCRLFENFENMDDDPRFYFVHSYHLSLDKTDSVIATASHGYEFPAVIQMRNIFGTQFHPEKSHKFGMKLLKNFADL